MELKKTLFELPFPSTSTAEEPKYVHEGGKIVGTLIGYDVNDILLKTTILFTSVRAVRYREDGHCTAWHLEASDTLKLVENSHWVKELLSESGTWHEDHGKRFRLNHYVMYMDSFGCFEVIAGDPEISSEILVGP